MGRVWPSLLVWVVLAGAAEAQEAPPVPLALGFSPDTTEPVLIRARDAGLVVLGADGRYRLLCAAALGISGSASFHVQGLVGSELLIGSYAGLLRSDEVGCNWAEPEPALEGVSVSDVERHGDLLYLLGGRDQQYSVFRSDDRGESFAHAFDLPSDAAFFALAVAPSNPQRMYASGVVTDVDAGTVERFLFRSDDGGESFSRTPIDLGDEPSVELLGVDPDDPDRLYMAFAQGLSSHSHGDEMPRMDRLLVTEDHGATLRELREVDLFGGFAFGEQPGEQWLGDAEGGLLRSFDSGETFESVTEAYHVSCIERAGSRLWLCADSTQDDFSIGYSDDQGASFTGHMRFDEVVGQHACAEGLTNDCRPQWSGWMFWHQGAGVPSSDASVHGGSGGARGDASVGEIDAGPGGESDDGDDGCGCRLATGGSSGWPMGLALLWLLGRVRWRRREAGR